MIKAFPYVERILRVYVQTQLDLIEPGLAEIVEVRINWYPEGSSLRYHTDPKHRNAIYDNWKEGKADPREETLTRGIFPLVGAHWTTFRCSTDKARARSNEKSVRNEEDEVVREEVRMPVGVGLCKHVMAYVGLACIHALPFYHGFEEEEDLVKEGFCAVVDMRHKHGKAPAFLEKIKKHHWSEKGMPKWGPAEDKKISKDDVAYLTNQVSKRAPARKNEAEKARDAVVKALEKEFRKLERACCSLVNKVKKVVLKSNKKEEKAKKQQERQEREAKIEREREEAKALKEKKKQEREAKIEQEKQKKKEEKALAKAQIEEEKLKKKEEEKAKKKQKREAKIERKREAKIERKRKEAMALKAKIEREREEAEALMAKKKQKREAKIEKLKPLLDLAEQRGNEMFLKYYSSK